MKCKGIGLSLFILGMSFFSQATETNEQLAKDSITTETVVVYDDPRDPFEGFNRAMWDLNYLYLDRYIYRPVAHTYNDYLPRPVKSGVDNFVRNFEEPSSLVNNALQGKWGWAVNAGGRFTINTTIGILCIVDVADMMGL